MEERNTIIRTISLLLHEMKPQLPIALPPTDDFKQHWGLESLDLAEYVARIEQHYSREIPDIAWEQMTSIDKIADYLLKQPSADGK